MIFSFFCRSQNLLAGGALLLSTAAAAQGTDTISLADIWSKGTFRQKSVPGFNALNDGVRYSTLEQDSLSRILVSELGTTGGVPKTLWSGRFDDKNAVQDYTFSTDENRLLLATSPAPVYRRSVAYRTRVQDLKTGQSIFVDSAQVLHATFSPDGQNVAFVKGNNLYYRDLAAGKTVTVTTDGKRNEIINGNCDWVYEEEFEFTRAFQWSPDGRYLAYYRFDERAVPEYSFPLYDTTAYSGNYVYKYPKAGAPNSVVGIYIYDLQTGQRVQVAGTAEYTPRIQWVDNNRLCVLRMNRWQNNLDYLLADAATGNTENILTETDKAYVEINDNRAFFPKNNTLVYTSERGGYNQLWAYDWKSKKHKLLSPARIDVDHIVKLEEKEGIVYFVAAPNTVDRHLYRTSIAKGAPVQLTTDMGTHEITPAGNGAFLDKFSTMHTPPVYRLIDKNGALVRTLEDNSAMKKTLQRFNWGKLQMIRVPVPLAGGKAGEEQVLNGWMITPPNFDSTRRYPVLMNQYSGPGSQKVVDQWGGADYYFHQMLAQQGYIVVCVDGTGTGYRGSDFKKRTYLQLGKYESDDQIAAANWLRRQAYVNPARIGIWGWSYGGFMSSTCIFKAPDVFKAAIAVAPVTNWRFYDNVYTERYMRQPFENVAGYEENAPVNMAKNLKGNFLLVHGTADDNVHFQNAAVLVEKLIQANRKYESEFYPNKAHGISGGVTRLHLYERLLKFIQEKL